IFGREGLDMAARYLVPVTGTPTYNAFKMYRNYDGNKSTFGDTSVLANGPDADEVSVFSALRSTDNALTIMVVGKFLTGTKSVNVNISNFAGQSQAKIYQLTSENVIKNLNDISYSDNKFDIVLPAQSITLIVIPS